MRLNYRMKRKSEILKEWRDYLEQVVNRYYKISVHLLDLDHHRIKMKDFERRFKRAAY